MCRQCVRCVLFCGGGETGARRPELRSKETDGILFRILLQTDTCVLQGEDVWKCVSFLRRKSNVLCRSDHKAD